MEHFIQYVSQFEPDFASRIRGASEEEIDTLERLAGLRLPPIYRTFLSRMGHASGGIDIAFEGTTRITEVIDYYQNSVRTGKARVPPNSLIIGIGSPPTEDVALQLGSDRACPAFLASEGELLQLLADSLETLLFRVAFATFRMKLFHAGGTYRNNSAARQRELADAVAVEIGYQRQWFSDSIEFCGERRDSAIIINQYQHHGLAIRIRAESDTEVESIGSVFAQRLGVVRQSQANG